MNPPDCKPHNARLCVIGAVRSAWDVASGSGSVSELTTRRGEVAQQPEAGSSGLQCPHPHQQVSGCWRAGGAAGLQQSGSSFLGN